MPTSCSLLPGEIGQLHALASEKGEVMTIRGTRLSLGVLGVLSLLVLAFAGPASAAKPEITAAFGVAGHQVNATGTVGSGTPKNAAPRKRWRAVLEEESAGKWVALDSAKLSKPSSSYALSWTAPTSQSSATLRVRVRAKKKTIATSESKSLNFSASGPSPDPIPDPDPGPQPQPAPTITSVARADVVQLPSASDPTLIVSGSHSFAPGEYLAATPGPGVPEGFLLKVVSSTVVGGNTEVETEPGSLYDAIPNGSISADLGDLASATPQNADARTFSKALAADASQPEADVPFNEQVSCSGSASMNLDGNLTASLDPNLELEWSRRFGFPTGIDHARATVDAAIAADAQASVSGSASCELEELTLLAPRWTVVVLVGAVPVPLTIEIPINLNASASVEGAISVSADASMQGSLGIQYEDGDVSGVRELSSSANVDHSVDANASAEARIGPDVGVKAGWEVPVLGELAATAGIEATSGLRLTYVLGDAPPGKLCVPVTAEARIGFNVPVVGEFTAGPETLYDEDIVCAEFGTSGDDQLHWEGTMSVNLQGSYSSEGGEHAEGLYTREWTVNGNTPEGGRPYYGEDGNGRGFQLPGVDEWDQHHSYVAPCTTSAGTHGTDETRHGSGTPSYPSLLLVVDPDGDYGFSIGPTVEGTRTITWHQCDGEVTSKTDNAGPSVTACLEELEEGLTNYFHSGNPLPRDGTSVANSVSGQVQCDGINMSWDVTFDFTVTCPGGSAPDGNWMCSGSSSRKR